MRLLLSVDGMEDRAVQVADGVSISDVSGALGLDPTAGLTVVRTGRTLSPTARVTEADLRSGDHVIPVRADGGPAPSNGVAAPGNGVAGPGGERSRTWRPAAMLRILSGPSAPASVEIAFGETTIGRGLENDVVVADEGMSRCHASIIVDDDSVEIVDRSSMNGVVIDGELRRERTTISRGKRVLLGKTWIEVDHLRRQRGLGDLSQNSVEFNRPPRLVRPYQPAKFELPVPPDHPPRQRIPKISALAPLLLGVFMIYMPVLAGGRPNYLFGAFMLFSPVMLFASYFENRSGARANFRHQLEHYEKAVAELEDRLELAHAAEQQGRCRAAPPAEALTAIVDELSPRLWERGLDEPDALSVRIGLADQPSQNEIVDHDRGPADLREAIENIPARFATVAQVPALASLRDHGGIGVSGPQEYGLPLASSIVAQLATLHSPAELLVAAMIPESAVRHWDWLKWLPHCPVDDSPLGGRQLAADEISCRGLLARLLQLVDQRVGERVGHGAERRVSAPAVVVAIGEGVPVEQHELTRLIETGPAAGVYVVWVAGASRRVPRAIGNVVDIDADGRSARLGLAGTNRLIENIAFETLDPNAVLGLARRLSPVEDVGSRFAAASMIPSRVGLVDLLGGPAIMEEAEPTLDRWRQRPKTLSAPVGRLADGVFELDIRRDGPHALVGGTTGAGKSEFLQSWVMSLAATHSPATVTFLLVDYKGGAAFKDCSRLPHTVGMVTDLDNAGVRRALVSLAAELRHREELLAEHDCSDLLEMIDKQVPGTPPSLLIIVDEFAALVQEVPEFVDGMVGVAQRGRSLGLHLVLATQRPAGVITGQVKSNTDLRIALRMADSEDSTDVIDSPAAADIDRAIPGRAIARISRNRFAFQSAYVGGVSGEDDAGPEVEVGVFDFAGVTPIRSTTPALVPAAGEQKATDLERLVRHLRRLHDGTGEALPRQPWLEPLGPAYDLGALPMPDGDDRLLLGMVDVPERQAQVPLHFDPDADGSMGIVGAGGSGKTVALRTICASAALHLRSPRDVPRIYCLDFAGRGLRTVEPLPHVAAVVTDDDPERVRRVLSDIRDVLDARTEGFARVRASSLEEFRQAEPELVTDRIYLLIDGYPAFHEMFEPVENERWIKLVRRFIVEGRQFGIHVVLTAPRREAIYSTVVRTIGRWLILRQTSIDDYRSLEVATDVLDDKAPAGRAIEGDNVAQLGILGGSPASDRQADAMVALAGRLVADGIAPAPPVRVLPPEVSRFELSDPAAIGLRDRDLGEQVMPSPLRAFLITGPRSSGKSTALATIGNAVGPSFGEVFYLAAKAPPVAPAATWQVAVGQAEIDEVIYPLLSEAGMESGTGRLVLVDDAYGLFELGVPVDQLAEASDGRVLSSVMVLSDIRARSGYDAFAQSLTANASGLLLRPSPLDDAEIYGLALPRVRSHLWPQGRGYLVQGQTIETVQIAR